jgi:UDP-2,3-diacylglucosamine hydrolase
LRSLSSLEVASALVFSDVHLSDDAPALTQGLLQWLDREVLQNPAPPDALLVLGDLFDAWIGDDALTEAAPSDVGRQMVDMLAQISSRGIQVGIMHGNRDFLLADAFADQCGAFLMHDPFILKIDQGPTIALTHGDLLCTADTAYQQFRSQVRQPTWQTAFLSQPLARRVAAAQNIKDTSNAEKAGKEMQIMDVTPEAAATLTDQLAADLLLHGHTHRPGVSTMPNDKPRWVLSDWAINDQQTGLVRGGGIWLDAQGPRTRSYF